MTKFAIGTNTIENCGHALRIRGTPAFSHTRDGDRIRSSFEVPSPPAGSRIVVRDNRVEAGNVQVMVGANRATVKSNGARLLEVIGGAESDVVRLDLRPLGLHVTTDDRGLHIGGSQLSGNQFVGGTTAIALDEPRRGYDLPPILHPH